GPVITQPSQTSLPIGDVSFIVYRRELGAVPDRVPIRIVAQIASALSFKDGKAMKTKVESSWAIRGRVTEFRAAPIPGQPQMLLLKGSDDAPLSPGRYAAVIGVQAFDFTIEGTPTDPAQCLERSEIVNGTIYVPCGK
ncbi:MAG: hypothetical protein AB7K04_14895, partial [Pseudorhodoplanes sp.]